MNGVEEVRGFRCIKINEAELFADVCVIYKDCAVAFYLERNGERIPVFILENCKRIELKKMPNHSSLENIFLKCTLQRNIEVRVNFIYEESEATRTLALKAGDKVIHKNYCSISEEFQDAGLLFWNFSLRKDELAKILEMSKILEWEILEIVENRFVLLKRQEEQVITLLKNLTTIPVILEEVGKYLEEHSQNE